MFVKIANNHAADGNGVEIKGIDRYSFSYHDGTRVLILGREDGITSDGRRAEIVNIDNNLHWEAPFTHEPLSASSLDTIIANIISGFSALGVETIIERRGI